MYAFRIFFQRRRKVLTRLGALLALGIGGTMAVLPRADAHGVSAATHDPKSVLLSPDRLSGERFAAFYELPHR